MEQAGMNEYGITNNTSSDSKPINTFPSSHNRSARGAFVCGIVAVSLNLLAVTAVIGLILGIIAIVLGSRAYQHNSYEKAGLVLGLLSMFIIAVYVISTVTVIIADPFL